MTIPTANVIEQYIPENGKNRQFLQIIAVFSAALGTLSLGALAAWTSPAILILTSNSSHIEVITLEEASYFTVIPPTITIVTAPILALLVDGVGRKKTVLILAVTYFLSWLLIAVADNLLILYLSRVLEGFGDATLFTVVPMYVGEVTEPHIRSSWGSLIAFFGFLGQFLVNVVGSYCDIPTTALILSCAPLLQFVLMAFMPESPHFLLMKNREEEARTSLEMLRWTKNIEHEFKTLSKNVQQEIAESGTFKDLFFIPSHRKTLFIAIGIRASQQLSGLPAFFMYTQYMFNQAGGNLSASTSAIIFSGAFVVVMAICTFFVSKFGRKPLMTLSCLGCSVVLAMEAIYFYISEKTVIDVASLSWIPLAGMVMFVLTCAPGLGLIPTVMLGELFPTSVKSKAMCILNVCFAIFVLVAVKLFQTLSVNFGMYSPFVFFSICCLVNVVFSYCCIPETKDKTLEEIQQSIRGQNIPKNFNHVSEKEFA